MKRTIYSFFKETAYKYPYDTAIIEEDRTLTLAQLDGKVNAFTRCGKVDA